MSENTSDVVVVGSGAAGMMAALRSCIGGAKVTVLEVSDKFGGTSAISGGGMWLPLTWLAKEAGVQDSREEVKRYLTHLTKGVIDECVVDRFIDTAPTIVDFIEEHTALRFYVDLERPDYKGFPGSADYGRLVAPKLYELSRLGDLRPKLRQPDWEARAKGTWRPGDPPGMEAVTQQEMQQFEESGNRDGWIELSRERVAKGIVPRGAALIGAMLETVAAHGANLVTNARAQKLTTDGGRPKRVSCSPLADSSTTKNSGAAWSASPTSRRSARRTTAAMHSVWRSRSARGWRCWIRCGGRSTPAISPGSSS